MVGFTSFLIIHNVYQFLTVDMNYRMCNPDTSFIIIFNRNFHVSDIAEMKGRCMSFLIDWILFSCTIVSSGKEYDIFRIEEQTFH